MSEPAPAPTPAPSNASTLQAMYNELKTFALGFVIAMAVVGQLKTPTPIPIPSPTPPSPAPVPVPTPVPPPTPIPVPVPPPPNPVPVPVPVPVPPAPVVTDFFRIGQAYGKAIASAYGDAWNGGFQIKAGDDLGTKLTAVKSAWDAARTAQFGATVAPEFEKLAPNHQAVDQATADALNKARADFVAGLKSGG